MRVATRFSTLAAALSLDAGGGLRYGFRAPIKLKWLNQKFRIPTAAAGEQNSESTCVYPFVASLLCHFAFLVRFRYSC